MPVIDCDGGALQAKVGIVVLHWMNRPETQACLDAVEALDYQPRETVVVDNSGELSQRDIAAFHSGPLTLLSAPYNLGYAGGNNLGIRRALDRGCDYVWLLNDDARVAPETLSALMAAARGEPRAGFLGPIVYMREAPDRVLSAGGTLDGEGRTAHRGLGASGSAAPRAVEDVDYLSGCALLVSRPAIDAVGLLDEDFFAYHEDVDWCVRGRSAGFRVLLVPDARVWHPDTQLRDEFSPHVTYYVTRNRLLFARKQRVGIATQVRMLGGIGRTLTSWSLRPKWRCRRSQRDAMARAVRDFLSGRVGPMPGTRRMGGRSGTATSSPSYHPEDDSQDTFTGPAASRSDAGTT